MRVEMVKLNRIKIAESAEAQQKLASEGYVVAGSDQDGENLDGQAAAMTPDQDGEDPDGQPANHEDVEKPQKKRGAGKK